MTIGPSRPDKPLVDVAQDTLITIPVIQEEVVVDRRTTSETTIRLTRLETHHDHTVDEPTYADLIEIQHVPINRYVDAPAVTRREGNTTIIPLMEEVLVVEKRLLLREEIHLTTRRTIHANPQTITLMRQDVRIERTSSTPDDNHPTSSTEGSQ